MSDPLVEVEGLEKHYPIREGLFNRQTGTIRAVDGIDFAVERGETVGLLGESGCGKSTAARSMLRIEEPTAGSVRFDGEEVTDYAADELRAFRRRAQLVLQNPSGSFDPRQTVGESVAEPLLVHGLRDPETREAIVTDLLERVGLTADAGDRYPDELSGGQKQRAALARALVLDPDLLVADEPVSALDVSIQAQVLQLLSELQTEFDLGVVLITHDMNVVREVCDRVAVMYAGELVEVGPTETLFASPQHPYTAALVDAVPEVGGSTRTRKGIGGEVPDPADFPDGCRFHPRCPEVIPPEGVDVDHDLYRRLVELRRAVLTGDAAAAVEGAGDDPRRAVRDAYDLPDPADVADDRVADALDTLVTAAVDPDVAERPLLPPALRSPCIDSPPSFVETDAGTEAACYLHHDR